MKAIRYTTVVRECIFLDTTILNEGELLKLSLSTISLKLYHHLDGNGSKKALNKSHSHSQLIRYYISPLFPSCQLKSAWDMRTSHSLFLLLLSSFCESHARRLTQTANHMVSLVRVQKVSLIFSFQNDFPRILENIR